MVVAVSDSQVLGLMDAFIQKSIHYKQDKANNKDKGKDKDKDKVSDLNIKDEYLSLNSSILKELYQGLKDTKILKSITIKNLNRFSEYKTVPLYSRAILGWSASEYSPDGILVPMVVVGKKDILKENLQDKKDKNDRKDSKDKKNFVLLSLYNIEGKKILEVTKEYKDSKDIVDALVKALSQMDSLLSDLDLNSTTSKKNKLTDISKFPKERLSFINTVPAGKIYIDGSYYGTSPLVSYLPFKNVKIKVVPLDKEYNTLNMEVKSSDLPLFFVESKSLMLEKDYLKRVQKLLSKDKNKKEAISILEQIPSFYSYYPKSVLILSKLLMEESDYKSVIQKSSFILSDRNFLKSENTDKDLIDLYMINNISTIKYALDLSSSNPEEKTEYFKDALVDGKYLFDKFGGVDKLDQAVGMADPDLVLDFWYYQGVANLKLWQLDKENSNKEALTEIWQAYLGSKKIDNYSKLSKHQKECVKDARKLYEYIK